MLSSHCLLQVFTKLVHLGYATMHFWLLLTQLASMAVASDWASNNSAVSIRPPTSAYATFDMHQEVLMAPRPPPSPPSPPLMDKTLTYCGSVDNINWQPVCATANNVDYVLFGSECLLWQTNRERHNLDTGESSPVFSKIAMGFCRPNCNVVICAESEQAICARNLANGEVRSFSQHCEMAHDVCLNDNDWQPIAEGDCETLFDNLHSFSRLPTYHERKSSTPETKSVPLTTPKIPTLAVHSIKLRRKQIKRKHQRKAIPCPKVFNPVCAELFGVKATFTNECLVNAENVNFGQSWQIISEGVCGEDYTSSAVPKNTINKRSTVDMASVIYQLNGNEKELKGNLSRTSNTGYVTQDILRLYGEDLHLDRNLFS